MTNSLDEILTWTSDQILQAAEDLGVNAESNGVVGIYFEVSGGPPVPISVGAESVTFVGVELNENGEPGRLRPGPVVRTFVNETDELLDYFGTGVTPGHVYYRAEAAAQADEGARRAQVGRKADSASEKTAQAAGGDSAEKEGALWLVELIAPAHTAETKHREKMLADLMNVPFKGKTFKTVQIQPDGSRKILELG